MTRLERGAQFATQEAAQTRINRVSRVPHDTVTKYREIHDDNHKIIAQIKDDHADVFPHHRVAHVPTDLKFRHLPSRIEAVK